MFKSCACVSRAARHARSSILAREAVFKPSLQAGRAGFVVPEHYFHRPGGRTTFAGESGTWGDSRTLPTVRRMSDSFPRRRVLSWTDSCMEWGASFQRRLRANASTESRTGMGAYQELCIRIWILANTNTLKYWYLEYEHEYFMSVLVSIFMNTFRSKLRFHVGSSAVSLTWYWSCSTVNWHYDHITDDNILYMFFTPRHLFS